MPAGADGSEGIDGGSGALMGSVGWVAAEEPESPRRRCSHLLIMRAMLQGCSAAR